MVATEDPSGTLNPVKSKSSEDDSETTEDGGLEMEGETTIVEAPGGATVMQAENVEDNSGSTGATVMQASL